MTAFAVVLRREAGIPAADERVQSLFIVVAPPHCFDFAEMLRYAVKVGEDGTPIDGEHVKLLDQPLLRIGRNWYPD